MAIIEWQPAVARRLDEAPEAKSYAFASFQSETKLFHHQLRDLLLCLTIMT